MIVHDLLQELTVDARFEDALEEIAGHELTKLGAPTISTTFVCALKGGDKRVRVSVEMIDIDDQFDDEK